DQPMRPDGFYTAWVTNGGAVDDDTAPVIVNRPYDDFELRLGNRPLAKENVLYKGPSGIRGLDQINFKAALDFAYNGCSLPVQFGVKNRGDLSFTWGNEVIVPFARTGVCGDRYGFGAEDRPLLTGAGLPTMEVGINETTVITSNAA